MSRIQILLWSKYVVLALLLIGATLLLLPKNDLEFYETNVAPKITIKTTNVQKDYNLLFMGDTMVARGVGDLIVNGTDPYAQVADVVASYDLKIANIETTIAPPEYAVQAKGKAYTFNAPIQTVETLKKHIDIAVLANNHTKDFGAQATSAMLDVFKAHSLQTVGAGKNVTEAFSPLIVTLGDGIKNPIVKVAFIALNDIENNYTIATASGAGSAYFDDQKILTSINSAKNAGAQVVVAVCHWGIEYTNVPTAVQKKWAHFLIDNGVDVVIGGHPHVVQPNEIYKQKPIVYSMGNFIFDGMSGDALNGQMIGVTVHASANFNKSSKAPLLANNAQVQNTVKNIPIAISSKGFPYLK